MQKFTSSILKLHNILYSKDMTSDEKYCVTEFLRKTSKGFDVKTLKSYLQSKGFKLSTNVIKDYLDYSLEAFEFEGLYYSRAGIYTGLLFSFKPTLAEYENRMIVLGSRCIPFLDPSVYSFSHTVKYGKKKLKKVIGTYKSEDAVDLFIGYGEEYCSQVINADPANFDHEGYSFELGKNTKLTGFDIGFLIDNHDFKYGDVLYCTVTDWEKGLIEISLEDKYWEAKKVLCALGGTNVDEIFGRKKMMRDLEEKILNCIMEIGPTDSIDHQLLLSYASYCKPIPILDHCNINEILKTAETIEIKSYGVESRIWKKDSDIPCIGPWNESYALLDKNINPEMKDYPFQISNLIIDEYIYDMFFDRSDDMKKLVSRVFNSDLDFSDKDRESLLQMMTKRSEELKADYNWFNDSDYGVMRKKALLIFDKMCILLHEIDTSDCNLGDLPQQDLSTLIQINRHLNLLLNCIHEKTISEEDFETYLTSVDGMNLSFEDVKWVIKDKLSKLSLKRFKVIK